MKKITYIIAGLSIGGAERMLFELATRLDTTQYRVEVISLSRNEDEHTQGTIGKALQKAGIPVVYIPKKSKFGIGLKRALQEHFKKSQPDIVHTHLFPADVWGAAAAHACGIPTLSTEHSVNADEGAIKHMLKCRTDKQRDTVVAVSQSVAHYVQDRCTHDPRVEVIPNGVDTTRFAYTPHPSAPPFELLVVGRLEPAKGHTNLLRALPHVQAHVAVRIVGDGSLRTDLEQLSAKLGLRERVEFVGAKEDVAPEYLSAALTVIPSNWEGQGIVALEAMASGCPVIAADVAGLRDVITHEQTGLLVDATQPELFAQAIDRVLGDSALQERLVRAARKEIETAYSVESMVQSYQKLYEDIANQ